MTMLPPDCHCSFSGLIPAAASSEVSAGRPDPTRALADPALPIPPTTSFSQVPCPEGLWICPTHPWAPQQMKALAVCWSLRAGSPYLASAPSPTHPPGCALERPRLCLAVVPDGSLLPPPLQSSPHRGQGDFLPPSHHSSQTWGLPPHLP